MEVFFLFQLCNIVIIIYVIFEVTIFFSATTYLTLALYTCIGEMFPIISDCWFIAGQMHPVMKSDLIALGWDRNWNPFIGTNTDVCMCVCAKGFKLNGNSWKSNVTLNFRNFFLNYTVFLNIYLSSRIFIYLRTDKKNWLCFLFEFKSS